MKLRYAVILSTLGHGILLMPWLTAVNFYPVSTPAIPYQITLTKESISKSRSDKITENNSASNVIKKERQTLLKEKLSSPPHKNSTELKNKRNRQSRAYVISRITKKIRNNFTYPRLARRNGWEGKVMLSLFVNSKGDIKNARIKSGSGYQILDQSALSALNKVKNIEKTKDGFIFSAKEFLIPVIYRLKEG